MPQVNNISWMFYFITLSTFLLLLLSILNSKSLVSYCSTSGFKFFHEFSLFL